MNTKVVSIKDSKVKVTLAAMVVKASEQRDAAIECYLGAVALHNKLLAASDRDWDIFLMQ